MDTIPHPMHTIPDTLAFMAHLPADTLAPVKNRPVKPLLPPDALAPPRSPPRMSTPSSSSHRSRQETSSRYTSSSRWTQPGPSWRRSSPPRSRHEPRSSYKRSPIDSSSTYHQRSKCPAPSSSWDTKPNPSSRRQSTSSSAALPGTPEDPTLLLHRRWISEEQSYETNGPKIEPDVQEVPSNAVRIRSLTRETPSNNVESEMLKLVRSQTRDKADLGRIHQEFGELNSQLEATDHHIKNLIYTAEVLDGDNLSTNSLEAIGKKTVEFFKLREKLAEKGNECQKVANDLKVNEEKIAALANATTSAPSSTT